jgi:hypothetical protein
MARLMSGGWGASFPTLARAMERQRIVPDGADRFFVVARNDRGTAFAHRFLRNAGGSGATDAGAPWGNWRYTGTAEMAGFASDPAAAFGATPPAGTFVYSDDLGAQDYALQASAAGKWMGSYHGGATPTSEAVRLDGRPASPQLAAAGQGVTVSHAVAASVGGVAVTLALDVAVDPATGGLQFALPSIASAGSFLPIYLGIGIATGGGWDAADLQLAGGTREFSLPVAMGTTHLGAAGSFRVRAGGTGRAIRVTSNAAHQPNFRRATLWRTEQRTKWYLEGASGANATKSGLVWSLAFERDRAAVSVPGANVLANPGFDADLAGWSSAVVGGAVAWNAGKLRQTRGATLDNRTTQALATAIGSVWLIGGEATTAAGPEGSMALANSATSTSSPAPAYVPASWPAGGGWCGHVAVATAATSWVMAIQGAGTAGQTTDWDNMVARQLAPAI